MCKGIQFSRLDIDEDRKIDKLLDNMSNNRIHT